MRIFQGSSWHRIARFAGLRSLCRVQFLRNKLSHFSIGEAISEGVAGQGMVAAAMLWS